MFKLYLYALVKYNPKRKITKDDVINFYSQIIDFNNCGDVYTKIFILTY